MASSTAEFNGSVTQSQMETLAEPGARTADARAWTMRSVCSNPPGILLPEALVRLERAPPRRRPHHRPFPDTHCATCRPSETLLCKIFLSELDDHHLHDMNSVIPTTNPIPR